MADQTLLELGARQILNAAIQAEVGITVRIDVPQDSTMTTPSLRAKQVLYRFSKEDADFKDLQIRLSPDDPDKELWIINKRHIS